MKLRELAVVKKGISINASFLESVKPLRGNSFAFLSAENFSGASSGKFISERNLKKLNPTSERLFLDYGDYIIYKKNNKFKIFRYEEPGGTTVLGNDLIAIQTDFSILKEFLGYEGNIRYFCTELEKVSKTTVVDIEAIGNIEIMTDNIRELDDSNTAEKIGIRRPLSKNDLPIRLTQKPLPLDKLLKRIKHEELLLDTEFQRRPGLWDLGTKCRLIESLIVRIPIPAFYFDGSDDNKWLVIDGLQRLSTINDFVNDKFALTQLDYLDSELSGKKFSELERTHQRNIEEYEVFAYILEKGTPISVKYKIFKNINTSALRLESQEIRHALNPGKPADLLKKIAEADWFTEKVKIPASKKDRMYDRETALRYIAFQRKSYIEYSPSIVEYLDEAITDIYDIPQHQIDLYEKDLKAILDCLYGIFEEPCFSRSILNNENSYIHNNILFELMTYSFSKLTPSNRKKLLVRKDHSKQKIVDFFKTRRNRFWDNDYAYSQEGLIKRFTEIEELMKEMTKTI